MRALLVIWLATAGLLGCRRGDGRGDGPSEGPRPPDIVMVVSSGLRADLPGAPGGAEHILLEALGPPRYRYTAAMSQSPAPYASLASLLTGYYPSAIPICNTLPDATTPIWCTSMPEQRYTIAKILGLYGYVVRVYDDRLDAAALLEDGMSVKRPTDGKGDWPDIVSRARHWWDKTPSPRFLLLVTGDMDARDLPHWPDREKVTAVYEERAAALATGLAALRAAIPAHYTFVTSTNGVSLAETTGLLEGADLFLSTANNGALLDRTVHVPLLVYGPPGKPETIDEVVELVDLVPTICKLAGAPPPANAPGADLFGGTRDNRGYAEFGDWLALREGPKMLTFRSFLHNGSSLDPENTRRLEKSEVDATSFNLHDVVADPLQATNLVPTDPTTTSEMRARLITMRTTLGTAPPDMLPADKVEQVRLSASQGYW